ncbi:DUF2254 family protein [Streptomyces sp. NBC_01244]|uniref:DUF2254 family protein n=1 Tax=Streptomyces sp. NBC_01244 TaxID=2903797 RepID=UPI002E10819F|nr:DUF2254 domain-containing protein [Streptomyces sp. NBC_01244]
MINLLFTIGFGVISLVSIIFSLLFLVVQWASTTLSPRLGLFRDDPLVWRTFAVAIGAFIFCVTAALAVGTRDRVSVAVPVLAMVLALATLALMRSLQVRAFSWIQLSSSLEAIANRGHQVFDSLYAKPHDSTARQNFSPAGPGRVVRWPHAGTLLQQIDVSRLVEKAHQHDSVVVLTQPPGHPLVRQLPVARVHGGDLPDDAVLAALLPGAERSFDQDPGLALRLLADIALRALSPAVNDPATAVQAIDHIEDTLLRLATQDLDVGQVRDTEGVVRVIVPVPDWNDYLRAALDDVVVAARNSPMCLLRLRTLLQRVLDACPHERRALPQERLTWVEGQATERFPVVWRAAVGGEWRADGENRG